MRVICKEVLHLNYETIDIDEKLNPDHIGSVLGMSFSDKQFDIVVCYQVLEHLPFESFEKALSELFRVAKRAVIISLPNAGKVLSLHITKICKKKLIEWPFYRAKELDLSNKSGHYWEINKKGYGINNILEKIVKTANKHNFFLKKDYRVWENPYHHFFVLINTKVEK